MDTGKELLPLRSFSHLTQKWIPFCLKTLLVSRLFPSLSDIMLKNLVIIFCSLTYKALKMFGLLLLLLKVLLN